jgi:hypothetical protein
MDGSEKCARIRYSLLPLNCLIVHIMQPVSGWYLTLPIDARKMGADTSACTGLSTAKRSGRKGAYGHGYFDLDVVGAGAGFELRLGLDGEFDARMCVYVHAGLHEEQRAQS